MEFTKGHTVYVVHFFKKLEALGRIHKPLYSQADFRMRVNHHPVK